MDCTRTLILLALLVAYAPLADAQSPDAAAVDATNDPLRYEGPPRKQDEVFRLSTRHLSDPKGDELAQFALHRWSESDAWESLEFDRLAGDEVKDRLTLIYVHGYGFDEEKANRTGWAFYHAICNEDFRPNVRFIIWSWPTTMKRFRPTRDLASKALRADADGFYLATMLSRLKTSEPVCVIGSSLGCRVVQGALHFAGGGTMDDWTLGERQKNIPSRLRAAYITACVHHNWLEEGLYHDRAVAGVDRLLLINNSADSTLLRYAKVWRGHPAALGLNGIENLSQFGELSQRIEQYDAHEEIGDQHGVEHYLRNPTIVAQLRSFAAAD